MQIAANLNRSYFKGSTFLRRVSTMNFKYISSKISILANYNRNAQWQLSIFSKTQTP